MPFYEITFGENADDQKEWHLAEHPNEAAALAFFNANAAHNENIGVFYFDKEGNNPFNSEYIFYEYDIVNFLRLNQISQFLYKKD